MLKNKNIVLTGSLQGIGKETVKTLARLGAHIWACSHYVDEEFLEFCNYESKRNSVEIIPISGDLSDMESVKTMAKEILKSKKDNLRSSLGYPRVILGSSWRHPGVIPGTV